MKRGGPASRGGRGWTRALASLLGLACALPPLGGCGWAARQRRERDRPYALAPVERIEVHPLGGHRFAAQLVVRGVLPDACTDLDDVRRRRSGRDFEITLTMRRRPGRDCGSGPEPYEKWIALYLEPGDYGHYRVAVNGVAGSFYVSSDRLGRDAVTDFDMAPLP